MLVRIQQAFGLCFTKLSTKWKMLARYQSQSFLCISYPHSFDVHASIESFWMSLLIGCDVTSPCLLCSSVILSSWSMFLLLLHRLLFVDLCAFSCSPSYIPPLLSFVSVSFSWFCSWFCFFFSPGSRFLEHIGDKSV